MDRTSQKDITVGPCGPRICYTCPSPNNRELWFQPHPPTDVDPVRRNIYYGCVISEFEPRDRMNDLMCSRVFVDTPVRPASEFPYITDVGFFLRHGESSACSPHWKNRYQTLSINNPYKSVGPAQF